MDRGMGSGQSPYFKRKTDANFWKRKKEQEKDRLRIYGSLAIKQNNRITFKEYVADWLYNVKIKNSLKTFKNYESTLKIHLLPCLGYIKLQSITIKDGQLIIQKLINDNYRPKTISNIVLVLKSVFNEAEKMEIVIKNPMKHLQCPKIHKKVPKYWNGKEINHFLSKNRSDELYHLYVAALNTGCRRGELAALQWHQILFVRNLIEVSATRDHSGRRENTKNSKNRHVPMNGITRNVFLYLFQNKVSEYVFTHTNGQPLRVNHLYRYFKKSQKNAGVNKVLTFHQLRDTFASNYMMNGGSIYDLQKILGHSSIDMTQIYAHLSKDYLSSTTGIISFGEMSNFENQFRPNIGLKKEERPNLISLNSVTK